MVSTGTNRTRWSLLVLTEPGGPGGPSEIRPQPTAAGGFEGPPVEGLGCEGPPGPVLRCERSGTVL